MDILKKVLPISGSNDESGQEPVSGEKGEGTATQPYDAGNQEEQPEVAGKALQHTEPAEEPVANQTQVTETGPSQATESKPDQSGGHNANCTTDDSPSAPKLLKKPTIGSAGWFSNANPFAKAGGDAAAEPEVDPKSMTPDQDQATAGAESPKIGTSALPPNHLGEDVPPGPHTVVVEPRTSSSDPAFSSNGFNLPNHLGEDVPPGQTAAPMDKGKGKAKMTDADYAGYESSSAASNRSMDTRNESVATEYTITSKNTYSTAGTGASTVASSSRRQSTMDAPHSQGKTITAGGIPLGMRAMEERQKRLSTVFPDRDYGHIDDITSSNTQRNSGIGFSGSDSGPSLAKHQQSSPQTKAPMSSQPTPEDSKKEKFDNAVAADQKSGRRHSSVMAKAKGFGRKFSVRIKPSK